MFSIKYNRLSESLCLSFLNNYEYTESIFFGDPSKRINFYFNSNNVLSTIEIIPTGRLLLEFNESLIKDTSFDDFSFLNYDEVSDCCYLKLPFFSNSIDSLSTKTLDNQTHIMAINVDIDKDESIVGIEIINASMVLPGYVLAMLPKE